LRTLLLALLTLLPWKLRRHLLQRFLGYELHPECRIGLAWVYPRRLVMGAGASIGHLTVVRGLSLLVLGEAASIGRLNWISAFPLSAGPTDSLHFAHLHARAPELILGEHAAITNRHILDCTERVRIGRFTTFAGFRSQILTHSIDLVASRQHAEPVEIGEFCFIGTACTLLGGAVLPHHCVLGANSLLNKVLETPWTLYGGVPAAALKPLSKDLAYFKRVEGFVA
jgi:carbonic anhydrase/acetyltransferase-like protein (isoleucine patch superfamily)